MTGPQKEWLDKHRAEGFRPYGRTPGTARWMRVGMLYPDGTYELKATRAWRYTRAEDGMFEVGVLDAGAQGMMRPGF